jgi:chorismate mutase/ribosomal protein S18 acetylase RimI-like enzyme
VTVTDLVLRPAAPDDAEAIAALYLATREAAVPAMPPQIHTSDEVRDHARREIDRHEVWVATDGPEGEVVGYAALSDAWLDGLYVAPGHQGRGVGTALLDLAKARRPRGFALWVFASNQPARRLYRRHGLVELEHTDGSGNEERSPDVRMDWPGEEPMSYFRAGIDAVDDEIAVLLARRQALTAAVQDHKPTGGHAGRDPERERAIAERMARHAPGLGAERMARVMDAVISVSLDAWEKRRETSAGGDAGEVG